MYWKVRRETVAQPICLLKIWTLLRCEDIHGRHHLSHPRHCPDAAAARHQRGEPSVQPPHAPPVLLLHAPPPVKHGSARKSALAEGSDLLSNASQSALQPNMQITVQQQQHGRVSLLHCSWHRQQPAAFADASFPQTCKRRSRRRRGLRT
jgi:hypothetical protein